jgi:hypothetical protein
MMIPMVTRSISVRLGDDDVAVLAARAAAERLRVGTLARRLLSQALSGPASASRGHLGDDVGPVAAAVATRLAEAGTDRATAAVLVALATVVDSGPAGAAVSAAAVLARVLPELGLGGGAETDVDLSAGWADDDD